MTQSLLYKQNKQIMKNASQNYALASDQDTRYFFLLKSPQLIANNHVYFEQGTQYQSANDKPILQPKTYYRISYVLVDKKKNKVKIVEAIPLGIIGQEWKSEIFLNHMKSFQGTLKKPEPGNPFMKEQMETGELRVNDEGWIYVKSIQSGYRKKLKLVNNSYAIPLLKGCKVDFFLRKYAENEGPKVKISGLNFKAVTLAGILKMINGRIFFQPRHTDYERMIPLEIPEVLQKIIQDCLPDLKGSLPYNIFKRYEGNNELLNKNLSQYVLQGRFLDWPLKFSHPVIVIEAIQQMNCNNLKQATLYELGIPFLDYDAKENMLSNQIIKSFDPEAMIDRFRVTDRCYSFDCQGGSCYDDAFSFKTTDKGYLVSIHISDVPSLVNGKPYLLERAQYRDQTIYIKNYYRSMFPEQLKSIMSLLQNRLRLTFTLTFQITKDGVIDYQTIDLRETTIKVVQNITHGQTIKDISDRITLSGLHSALKKCKLIQKLVVFDQIETAIITAQLLHLSAYLPIIAFNNNLKKLPEVTKVTEEVVMKLYRRAQEYIQELKILKLNENEAKTENMNEQEKIKSSSTSPMTPTKPVSMENVGIDIAMENSEYSASSESSSYEIEEEPLEDLYEFKKKNEFFQTQKPTGIKKNEFFRKVTSKEGSAAECFRFLDKLFRAAGLNVDFSHPKNMENAFKECQKKYKDKIALIYFRTKLIMSKQHFQSIATLTSEGKLKDFQMINSTSKFQMTPERKESTLSLSEKKMKVEQVQAQEKNSTSIFSPEKKEEFRQKDIKIKQAFEKPISPQEHKEAQPEKIIKDKQEHELSFLINIFTFLAEENLHSLCLLPKEQFLEAIVQLSQVAKEKKVQVIQRTKEEQTQLFNKQVSKCFYYSPEVQLQEIKPMKWNTPIRSGSSLHALNMLKNFSWIFQGNLEPSIAIKKIKEIPIVENQINQIFKERSRHQSMELNGRMKAACRQLEKIDFLFVLREQPDKVWDFLTITSPSQRVQFLYHESIEEVEVENPQKEVNFYTRVRGRFKGTFDFPIKLKVILEEK